MRILNIIKYTGLIFLCATLFAGCSRNTPKTITIERKEYNNDNAGLPVYFAPG